MYFLKLNKAIAATLIICLEQNTAKYMTTAVGLILLSWPQQGKITKKGQENKLQGRPLGQ